MQLGRIILLLHGESRALIKKKWLTKIFVTGDVLSFFLQAGGEYNYYILYKSIGKNRALIHVT
jgi:hypothetical protein